MTETVILCRAIAFSVYVTTWWGFGAKPQKLKLKFSFLKE
jgi:hypothetical protein